jgi:multidrug transporter EmrE-like cation transporter
MSEKKNDDFAVNIPDGSPRNFSRSEREAFLPVMPTRPSKARAMSHRSGHGTGSVFSRLEQSPGASIIAYCFSSISMTVVNKFVVSGNEWNLNFFYLAVQSTVCILSLEICKQIGLIKVSPFDMNKGKRWFPISVLLVGMIYTSTKSLQFLSVPVYTIFKNLTIIVTAYGEVLWFGGSVRPLALLSFGLMVLSSVIAAWADTSYASNTADAAKSLATLNAGYAWMGLNVFCTASYLLGMRKVIKTMNFKDWDSKYTVSITASPVGVLTTHSNVLQQLPLHPRSRRLLHPYRGLGPRQSGQELPRRDPELPPHRHDLLRTVRHPHLVLHCLVRPCHVFDDLLDGWSVEQAPYRRQWPCLLQRPRHRWRRFGHLPRLRQRYGVRLGEGACQPRIQNLAADCTTSPERKL